MRIDWKPFERGGPLPRERQPVLVQLSAVRGYTVGAVCVGYLRYAGGDKNSPFFVTPAVKRESDYLPDHPTEEAFVTHWADVFGDEFECPGWPGTREPKTLK